MEAVIGLVSIILFIGSILIGVVVICANYRDKYKKRELSAVGTQLHRLLETSERHMNCWILNDNSHVAHFSSINMRIPHMYVQLYFNPGPTNKFEVLGIDYYSLMTADDKLLCHYVLHRICENIKKRISEQSVAELRKVVDKFQEV